MQVEVLEGGEELLVAKVVNLEEMGEEEELGNEIAATSDSESAGCANWLGFKFWEARGTVSVSELGLSPSKRQYWLAFNFRTGRMNARKTSRLSFNQKSEKTTFGVT